MTSVATQDDEKGCEAPLAREIAEVRWLLGEYERIIADLAAHQWPETLERKSRIISILARLERPLPDELHELALRQALRANPCDEALTRSLVALLLRLGRPPFPEQDHIASVDGPGVEQTDIDARVAECLDADDLTGAIAVLWVRLGVGSDPGLEWARLAHLLADCGMTKDAADAFERALTAKRVLGSDTLDRLGQVAARLFDAGLIEPDRLSALADVLRGSDASVVVRHRANLERMAGNARAAAALARGLADAPDADAWTRYLAFKCHFSDGDLPAAYDQLRAALALDPMGLVSEILRSYSFAVSTLTRRLGTYDELADWLTAIAPDTPGINLTPPWPSSLSRRSADALRARALDYGLPGVVIAAQGKSGSVAISQILSHGFALPNVAYALTVDRVVGPWARDLARGGGCQTTHLVGSEINVRLLAEAGIQRVFVHLRDPRAQIVSLLHHFSRYGTDNPEYDARWNQLSFDERLDFCIASFLGEQVDWIRRWLSARDRLPIHLTTYESFVADREAFMEDMLAAYGGDTRHFDRDAALRREDGIDYHFRQGTADGWRKELKGAQIARINAAIPDELWTTFGWLP